jgi:hypothetical protein
MSSSLREVLSARSMAALPYHRRSSNFFGTVAMATKRTFKNPNNFLREF